MSLKNPAGLLVLTLTLLLPLDLLAQEPLSLQAAIRIGLENNYDIRIANKEQEIAEANVSLGNAGILPSLDGRVTRDFSQNDLRNQFESNPPRIVDNSTNNSSNASVLLSWTVFDGGRMFINYNRLKALEKSGTLLTRATLEAALASIINAYYEVVRQGQRIRSLEDAIAISEQRVEITQEQYNVGVSAKVEILRAQVDYNADRSEFLNQLELLKNAKITLNQLMGREPEIDFFVTDSITIGAPLLLGSITQDMASLNANLQRIQLERDLALYDLRSARALRYPVVGLAGSYGINRSRQAPAVFGNTIGTNESQRIGFNYGLTLVVPIFNGFEINRQIQVSRIAVETGTLALQREQNFLEAEVARAFNRYNSRLQLLELEESNLLLARQNTEIAFERYRLGLLTAIELREAQRNLLVAENRLIDILYEAKQAETELRRLGGFLLQDTP